MKDERIKVIDLLRGLSCLGVLLYHVRVDLWVGWWQITSYPQEYSTFAKLMAWLSVPTPFLGFAILLFFLISGFCIHYPNTVPNANPCWKTYFIRRFWRIYPTYFIAILFTALISYYCKAIWNDQTWDPNKILRVVTISQNYPPNNGQFLTNPSLWTIPLEIEFYALYPIAFCLISKWRNFVLLFATAFGLSWLCILLTKQGMQWLSFTFFFLWPSWLLGAWIASLYRKNRFQNLKVHWLTGALLVFLVLGLTSRLKNFEWWIQYASWTCFYFFLFILVLRRESSSSSVFQSWCICPLAWLGKISFSLYLIHFPLFKFFGYWHREVFLEKPANFLVALLYLIPVIFLAWIFFKFVEHPIHQWSKKCMAK